MLRNWFIAWFILALFSGCYSFRGTSINPGIQNFYVAQFDSEEASITPTLPITLTEKLKNKIRNESRLTYNETDPDIEFRATIYGFRVTAEAPQPGEEVSFNRLTIELLVEYNNLRDEEENWQSRFSFFADFPTDQNLIEVQDELIENIGDQLMEDIFNKTFTDW